MYNGIIYYQRDPSLLICVNKMLSNLNDHRLNNINTISVDTTELKNDTNEFILFSGKTAKCLLPQVSGDRVVHLD